jgi:hypothetical protein
MGFLFTRLKYGKIISCKQIAYKINSLMNIHCTLLYTALLDKVTLINVLLMLISKWLGKKLLQYRQSCIYISKVFRLKMVDVLYYF